MTDKSRLSLVYRGPAVDSGEMDAYEAGANIMAFGDFLGIVARSAYGDKAKVKSNLHGLRAGCFEIEFSVQTLGIIATMFSGPLGPKEIFELLSISRRSNSSPRSFPKNRCAAAMHS